MNLLNSKVRSIPSRKLVWLLVLCFSALVVRAQTFSNGNQLIDDGESYTVPTNDQNYRDLIIPSNTSYPYLKLSLQGADGGKVRAKVSRRNKNGGKGATVVVYVPIGTEEGQIPPGSTLRFMVGEKGENDESISSGIIFRGGGGGGGTGLAFKGPNSIDKWQLLAVAGGGSGAVSNATLKGEKGKAGQGIVATVPDTLPGEGGEEHHYDYSCIRSASGGGGAFEAGETSTCDVDGGAAGWLNGPDSGEPTGGSGGGGGGWGFGGGGGDHEKSVSGGGGGYSGGYAGDEEQDAGGSGTSFLNEYYGKGYANTNGDTNSPQDGFVTYQFTDRGVIDIPLAAATDKCLDLYKGLTDNYTNIQLYQCTGRSPQQWIIDGLRIRIAKNMDRCVNLKGGDMSDGTNIELLECNNEQARQLWVYDGFSGAFRSGKNPEHCMVLEGKSTEDDTNLQIGSCDESIEQQWMVEGAADLVDKDEVKIIRSANNTNKCLDLKDGITSNTSSRLQLSQCTGTDHQQWVFNDLWINYYNGSDICVNLDAGDTSNGTNIKVHSCNDKDRQVWVYDGLAKSIRSAIDPSKCMQVDTNDSYIEIHDCDGTDAQEWEIESAFCFNDRVPPVARCKDVTFTRLTVPEARNLDNGSYDNCSIGSMELENVSGNTWKLIVEDASGNTSSCTAEVTNP